MLNKENSFIVDECTLISSLNLDAAYASCLSFRETYGNYDLLIRAINSNVVSVWNELETIFRCLETAKLELDIARGNKTDLVDAYLKVAKERIDFFSEVRND